MKQFNCILLIAVFFGGLIFTADAQIFKKKRNLEDENDPFIYELPTYAVDLHARLNLPPNSEMPMLIYTLEPDLYMTGNRCVDEFTYAKGYLYVSTDYINLKDIDPIRLWFVNWPNKTRLFFRLGPFWKSKLNKRIEQCKLSSGFYR